MALCRTSALLLMASIAGCATNTNSLLLKSADLGDVKAAKSMLDAGADVNIQNVNKGFTPLHFAARGGYNNVVALLLDRGADVDIRSKKNITPIWGAMQASKYDTVALLLKRGASPNAEIFGHTHPLSWAILWEDLKLVEQLLDAGADPNLEDSVDLNDSVEAFRQKLHLVENGLPDSIALQSMTTFDLNTSMTGVRRVTVYPIHEAIMMRNIKIVEALLDHGARVDQTFVGNDFYLTVPFTYAVLRHDNEISKLLYRHGAKPFAQKKGLTPLHLAILQDDIELAEWLIGNGCDVNAQTKGGQTPLYFAISTMIAKDVPKMVGMLLNHGADPKKRFCLGCLCAQWDEWCTPAEWAEKRGQKEAAKLLREAEMATVKKI